MIRIKCGLNEVLLRNPEFTSVGTVNSNRAMVTTMYDTTVSKEGYPKDRVREILITEVSKDRVAAIETFLRANLGKTCSIAYIVEDEDDVPYCGNGIFVDGLEVIELLDQRKYELRLKFLEE